MSFQLAYPKGVSVPRIETFPLAAGAAFLEGSLVVLDSNFAVAECGADPASIGGVALSACGADTSGFNRIAKKEFPPGYMQVLALSAEVPLSARYVGTLPAADGGSFGCVKDTDGYWKIDFAETTATQFKLVRRLTNSPENVARVIVIPLVAKIQLI